MAIVRESTRKRKVALGLVALLLAAGSLRAHHSLLDFDTSAPVWVEGKVMRLEIANPHGRIYIEQTDESGQVHPWVVEGASPLHFKRMGLADDRVKVGDVVKVCGFESRGSQWAFRHGKLSSRAWKLPGRLMNGNLLVLPDGEKKVLSNYGELYQCLDPRDWGLLKQ